MNSQKLRVPLLVGAIAAVAATAWAANESEETVTVVEPIVVSQPIALREPIAVTETLSPNETLVVREETVLVKQEAPIAVAEGEVTQPPITVEERRLSRDEVIQLA